MKLRFLVTLAATALPFATLPARAQWFQTTYALKGGWNAIFLHGDASYADPDTLFPNSGGTAGVQEVWRWNPKPNQVQFTASPLIPSPGTPEWNVWKRGRPLESNLSLLTGQTAYLVKCSGLLSASHSVPIVQKALPPAATWVRSGANLLGFPTKQNAGNYPSFSTYFQTFPAATSANTKIYKYVGGDLGPANPLQTFSPSAERVDRNQAYWFEAEVVGNFFAPLDISLSQAPGIDFGRTGAIVTARVRNTTAANITLTLTPVASLAAPSGQDAVTGQVPLMKRTFDTGSASWLETPTVTIASPAAAILQAEATAFIDGGAVSGITVPVPGAGYFSPPDITIEEPPVGGVRGTAVAAVKNGMVSGISVTSGGIGYTSVPAITVAPPPARTGARASAIVENGKVTGFSIQDGGSGYLVAPSITLPTPVASGTTTARTLPLRVLLHVEDGGAARLLSQVFLGKLTNGTHGICTREAGLSTADKASAARFITTHLPLDRVLGSGSGTVAPGQTLVRTVSIPFDDDANPFVHRYHPDHNNKDARGNPLGAGVESYGITRTISFQFTTVPPSGVSPTGWGSSTIGGNYTEVIKGLHRQDLTVTGTFVLRRASENGNLTIN